MNSPWELNSGDLGADRADSQTGLAVPDRAEAGPAGQDAWTQEEMSDGLSLPGGFRKIPAWKIPCLPGPSWITQIQVKKHPKQAQGDIFIRKRLLLPLASAPQPEGWAWEGCWPKCCHQRRPAGKELHRVGAVPP